MNKEEKCKNCKHWKNEQAELEYDSHYGICTCFKWRFTINENTDVAVLDRSNLTEKYKRINRFENQNHQIPVGNVEKSRYCLVTNENFCCSNHEKK
jgi:hypothetical protein